MSRRHRYGDLDDTRRRAAGLRPIAPSVPRFVNGWKTVLEVAAGGGALQLQVAKPDGWPRYCGQLRLLHNGVPTSVDRCDRLVLIALRYLAEQAGASALVAGKPGTLLRVVR